MRMAVDNLSYRFSIHISHKIQLFYPHFFSKHVKHIRLCTADANLSDPVIPVKCLACNVFCLFIIFFFCWSDFYF